MHGGDTLWRSTIVKTRLPAGEHCTLGGQGPSAKQIFGCREQTSPSAHPPFSNTQDGRQKAASDPPNGTVYLSQVAWEGQLNSSQGPGQEIRPHSHVRPYTRCVEGTLLGYL